MSTRKTNPKWNTPISNKVDTDTVVIYPEITTGNPLKSNKVVRYVLNKPGLLGGEKYYSDNEYVLVHSLELLDSAQEATAQKLTNDNILFIDVIEPNLFCNKGLSRDKECFYIGKGSGLRNEYRIDEKGLIEITAEYPDTREKLAQLLNETKTLYLYDNFTALSQEAKYCGCDVFYIEPDGLREAKSNLGNNPYKVNQLESVKLKPYIERLKEFFK